MESKDFTFVFVGCGGTFWAGTPYLSVLLRRYQPMQCVFIDPDKLSEDNLERQWSNAPEDVDSLKVDLCDAALGLEAFSNLLIPASFEPTELVRETLKQINGPVMAIVNTDNNASRLNVWNWCKSRDYPTAMVVSGCDAAGGQAYWGHHDPMSEIPTSHDWLKLHPDVAEELDGEPRHGCGGQTIYANAITGQLLGLAIENCMRWLEDDAEQIREFYWSRDEAKGIRVWETRVQAMATV